MGLDLCVYTYYCRIENQEVLCPCTGIATQLSTLATVNYYIVTSRGAHLVRPLLGSLQTSIT